MTPDRLKCRTAVFQIGRMIADMPAAPIAAADLIRRGSVRRPLPVDAGYGADVTGSDVRDSRNEDVVGAVALRSLALLRDVRSSPSNQSTEEKLGRRRRPGMMKTVLPESTLSVYSERVADPDADEEVQFFL